MELVPKPGCVAHKPDSEILVSASRRKGRIEESAPVNGLAGAFPVPVCPLQAVNQTAGFWVQLKQEG